MDNPRPDKIAVIDEVRERVEGSNASVVAEYRGLTVAQMAELRRSLRAAGGDFKVFKNTLVKRAIAGTSHEALSELLSGPTGIAFIEGDVSAVAKALKTFADENPALVIKGGVLEGAILDPASLKALASLPSREAMLAMFAGLLQSPMAALAGLMKAVPQSLAYGLRALIDSMPAEAAPQAAEAPAETPVEEPAIEAEAPAEAEVVAEAEAPAEDAAAESPAEPVAEAVAEEAPAESEATAEEPAPEADEA